MNPVRNAPAAPRTAPVLIPFSQNVDPATASGIKLFSSQYRGRRTTATSTGINAVTVTPTAPTGQSAAFKPGETVTVTVTSAVQNITGAVAAKHVYQFSAAATGGSGNFITSPDITGTGGLGSAAVGDIDGDNDLDMVIASYGTATVLVRFNDGNGAFSGTTSVSVDRDPMNVALADVDGDGDLDVLTANLNGNTISVRLNNGAGVFSGATNVPVAGGPTFVAAGDVDGDGDVDLLAACLNNNGLGIVNVRLNNGSGVFSAAPDVSVGVGPFCVALGDVDSDGDLDLLTANDQSNEVSVRLNNGNGVFSGGSDVAVGVLPRAVALGDVDGDGDLDFVAANATSSTASVRLNNGAGTFAGGTEVPVGNRTVSLVLGDVDGDGDLDIFAANAFDSTVSIRRNNGTGTFTGNGNVSVGYYPENLAIGDMDGDGDLDLVTANYYANSVSVRFNARALATANPALTSQVMLYPNPAERSAVVRLAVPVQSGTREVLGTVLNSLGQTVATMRLQLLAGQAVGELPLADLASGIYTVRLQVGTAIIAKRLEVL